MAAALSSLLGCEASGLQQSAQGGGELGADEVPEDKVKRGAERRCEAAFRKARIAQTGHVVVPVAPTINFTDHLSWSGFDP